MPSVPTKTNVLDKAEQVEACLSTLKALQPRLPGLSRLLEANPFASVIVCSYNRPGFLYPLLNQLIIQTYKNYEVIIIDGSDNPLITRISEFPTNFQFFCTSLRYVMGILRNLAILVSRGEIIIFVDDDSYVAQDFVARHVALHSISYDEKVAAVQGHSVGSPHDERGNGWVRRVCTFKPNGNTLASLVTTNCSIKRSALEAVGGFNMDIRLVGDDTELGRRFKKMGYTIRNGPEVITIHRGASEAGARCEPAQRAWWVGVTTADRALTQAALKGCVAGALCIGKNLFPHFARDRALFRDNFSLILSESWKYFWQKKHWSCGTARMEHLRMTEKLFLQRVQRVTKITQQNQTRIDHRDSILGVEDIEL